MDVLISQPVPQRDEGEFELFYEANFEFLVSVAVRKFRVPDSEAETLAHEVFLTYLRKANAEIRDLHSWLVGAICHASRYYWRSRGRNIGEIESEDELERIDPASTRILDSLPDQLAAREALELLPPRYQEVLRLRYFEGMSINELADHLGVTPKYAQKLVTKCLRRAEQRYTEQGAKR
jgi:RNA polymerase sigma factor (sigma-70 family)